MSCNAGNCDTDSVCYVTDPSTGLITKNNCCDPNNACTCSNGKCFALTCSSDSYCAALGNNCKCVNGRCTCSPCTYSSDCPLGTTCNGGICSSISCSGNDNCPSGTKCYNGYCTLPRIIPMRVLLLLIIMTVIISVIGYFSYKTYYKK